MTDIEIVRILAEKVMGWKATDQKFTGPRCMGLLLETEVINKRWFPGCKGGNSSDWNPLESWADCMEMEDVIATWPLPKRQKYISAIYNGIAGSDAIIGTTRAQWGMLHASQRSRCLAVVEAIGGGK